MSGYIINIDSIDGNTLMTVSSNIPSIYKDAIEWMQTTFLKQPLCVEDGKYFAKLKHVARVDDELVIAIEVNSGLIIKVNNELVIDKI